MSFLSIFSQVKIMKNWDPSGKDGPRQPLPDLVVVSTPKASRVCIPLAG